jgi:hypothetical protein
MSNIEDDEQFVEPPKPFCHKCGSTDIRASQSHRMMDSLLKSFSLHPYRCRCCRKRFYLRTQGEPEEQLADDAGLPDHGATDSGAKSRP